MHYYIILQKKIFSFFFLQFLRKFINHISYKKILFFSFIVISFLLCYTTQEGVNIVDWHIKHNTKYTAKKITKEIGKKIIKKFK